MNTKSKLQICKTKNHAQRNNKACLPFASCFVTFATFSFASSQHTTHDAPKHTQKSIPSQKNNITLYTPQAKNRGF